MESNLKEAIEKKFGTKILNRGDCEKLAQVIFEQTGNGINYNTLRRIYGLAPPVKVRIDTLNTLSVYVGYGSYYQFRKESPYEISWAASLEIYEHLFSSNQESLLALIKDNMLKNEDYLLPLINITREYIIDHRIDELVRLFNSDFLNPEKFRYKQKLILGNSVGILLRTHGLSKKEVLKLSKSRFYRTCIFEIFVDYSSFDGYYSSFLSVLLNSRLYKNKVFVKCLLNTKAYLNCTPTTLFLLKNKEIKPLHPILKGRYFSNFLLDRVHTKELFYAIKTYVDPTNMFQLFYEPMVISIVTKNVLAQAWLIEQIESQKKHHNYGEPHYNEVYKLMQTQYYQSSGDFKKANSVFAAINADNFILSYKSFLLFFYNEVGYCLSKTEEMRGLLKRSLKNNPYKRLRKMV